MKRGEFAAWAASPSSATAWEFLVMLTETRGGSLAKNMGQQMATREPRVSALTLGKSLPFSLLVSSSGSTEIPVLDISWLLLSIRNLSNLSVPQEHLRLTYRSLLLLPSVAVASESLLHSTIQLTYIT